MIDAIKLQSLRELPIEGVAQRLGFRVTRHKALCPFHNDSNPSLTFNIRKNSYRCYVCDAHGGTIDLVMNFLHKSFIEACNWLADENNIILKEYKSNTIKTEKPAVVDIRHLSQLICQPVLIPEARRFLFNERRLSKKIVEQLGISSISCNVPMSGNLHESWFNAPAILIPYKDINGNLISVQARYLGSDKNKPRFQFPKGSVCSIFNLPVLKTLKAGEPLFITEGVTDCLAMLSVGHKAIAIPSATLLKSKDVELIKKAILPIITKEERGEAIFHIYPDQDAPGERLYLTLRDKFSLAFGEERGEVIRHQLPEGFKDVGQYYAYINKETTTCK